MRLMDYVMDPPNVGILHAMVHQADAGFDIVCASLLMPGGSMIGCPWLKAALARIGKFTLYHLAQLPTRDAGNGFRLFSRLESDRGFCYSIELLVKCRRLDWRIGEVPDQWSERAHSASRFQVVKWLRVTCAGTFTHSPRPYLGRPPRTERLNTSMRGR
jgi:dolichol-phosphate mannosyltransferase